VVLRLSQSGVARVGSSTEWAEAKAAFETRHAIAIPSFIEPSLFATVERELTTTEFEPRLHDGIASELCAKAGRLFGLLQFLGNDPALFSAVEELTGSGAVKSFEGRIYRFAPNDHHDSWHDDCDGSRLVGMSVNLGSRVYSGGLLQIRDCASKRVLTEVPNTSPGGAILFRIAPSLQHQVTSVTGETPKTAFAGWFRDAPDFRDVLAGRASW
jgi:hypothetical protein